jgi:hypothetical protein
MATGRDIIFGRLFLARAKSMPPAVVAQCLEGTGPQRSLADALVVRGLITQRAADYLKHSTAHMEFMRSEMLFARILLQSRMASYYVVQRGMAAQERGGYRERLAELLLRTRQISQAAYDAACAEHLLALAEDSERLLTEGLTPGGDAEEGLANLSVNLASLAQVPKPRFARPKNQDLIETQPAREASSEDALELDDPHLVPSRTLPVDSRAFAAELPKLTETDDGMDLASEVGEYRKQRGMPPLEQVSEKELSPERIQRAFDSALLMAGMDGTLHRKNPGRQAPTKPCRVIYDAARDLFKAPLAPTFDLADTFQLSDGSRWRVDHVDVFRRLGTNCYQQILATEVSHSSDELPRQS